MKTIFKHEKLGIKNPVYAVIEVEKIQGSNPQLEKLKQQSFERIKGYKKAEVENNKVYKSYKRILVEEGFSDWNPAGYNLIQLLRSKEKPLTINTAVDAYNIIASETFLAIGAHDLDKIGGGIEFGYSEVGDTITPINTTEQLELQAGGYCLKDQATGNLLSFLDAKDSDHYKLTAKTKKILLVIEGTDVTSLEFNLNALQRACELIVKFCGGNYEIFSAKTNESLASGGSHSSQVQEYHYTDKLKTDIQQLIFGGINQLAGKQVLESPREVIIEEPNDPDHGDFSSNIAMQMAARLKTNPRQIAQQLIEQLEQDLPGYFDEVEVAGPGFVNFKVSEDYYLDLLNQIDGSWGEHNIGEGGQVMVEFGQPNTHKAMHIGHIKSAISGLSLVRLYENVGYDVIKTNFYGDVGMHVAKSVWGALQKGYQKEAASIVDVHAKMKLIGDFYAYASNKFKHELEVEQEIRQINRKIYKWTSNDKPETEDEVINAYQELLEWSLMHQTEVFKRLGYTYDREYPESEMAEEAIQIVQKNLGEIFTESEGAIIFDGTGTPYSTYVFITKEGLPTYEAKDLALAYKKFQEYDPDLSVITTAVEQNDRFRTVIHCLERIDEDFVDRYKHIGFGWLLIDGKKTSSRKGNAIIGVDLIEESVAVAKDKIAELKKYSDDEVQEIAERVGQSGLKFLILSQDFHKDINYDPDEFLSLEGFSGPYVMYANARANALLRDAEINVDEMEVQNMKDLQIGISELRLLKQLSKFPQVTLAAAEKRSPHLIAHYVYELANKFNQFYTEVPILKEENGVYRKFRLQLTQAAGRVIEKGMHLLGIETVERM